ncbi:MAG: indole-3-glycerol phosphate synthase TrpC [candidate division Zixibacteria bacterium]|nr:indole-3-glycerol phosphate synthase TrpC [candidate division Zixibacteria bacterium]
MADLMSNDITRQRERPIPAILQSLIVAAGERVARLHREQPAPRSNQVVGASARRSLLAALTKRTPAIIAEIKKASPSKGIFRDDFDPIKLATSYASGGAAAISVVTEPEYFQGDPGWLAEIRSAVTLPILRKDFIIDAIQVSESAALGADAILLIARILNDSQLTEFKTAADGAGLEVLFEIHDEEDLRKILPLRPQLIGINARNLDDFTVDTNLFRVLVPMFPSGTIAVAESGLDTPTQIQDLSTVGFQGFLIGETLIRSHDPARMLRQLRGAK